MVASLLLGLLWLGGASAEVTQTLDSVDAISTTRVLEMRFGDQPRPLPGEPGYDPVDAASLTTPGERFLACQRAANRDLYCLLASYKDANGKLTQPVRRWSAGGSTEDLFSCTDPSLGLDTQQSNPCTALTVDLAGNLWIGARTGSKHSVIKIVAVAPGGSCSAFPFPGGDEFRRLGDLAAGSDFCFRPYVTGRAAAVDMTTVDPQTGAGFHIQPGDHGGPGLLVLDNGLTVIFVADPTNPDTGRMGEPLPPVVIGSGKSAWGIERGESLQSVALLQVDCAAAGCAEGVRNFVLVTTALGKLIGKPTDPLGTPVLLFQNPSTSDCGSSATPQYWVRVSPQSGLVYVSDRSFAVVRELEVTSQPLALAELRPPLSTSPAASIASGSLSTLSVSPGIGFNLNDCLSTDCVLAPDDGDGNGVGARISGVDIDPAGQSGLTVFRITGIPDCRYAPHRGAGACAALPDGGIVVIGGKEYLDVSGLLPPEVRALFNDSTEPALRDLELLIGPQFRARPATASDPSADGTFEAFFGRTEDGGAGVVFRDTFDVTFDIGQLTQSNLSRCGYLNADPARRNATEWDLITTVSERSRVAGIANGTAKSPAGPLRHVDMLVNTFCENPTSGAGVRWSLYAYGLMLADTGPDGLARLLSDLYDDLERARALTACTNFGPDGNAGQPLSPSACSALAAAWKVGRDKLDKCIAAARQPKASAGNQNCQAFSSQLARYRGRLAESSIYWADPAPAVLPDRANRRGELEARTDVIAHVLNDQFLPSIPRRECKK